MRKVYVHEVSNLLTTPVDEMLSTFTSLVAVIT